ncbi:MAG TPA: hypothetical protein VNK96_04280 [Fimbriimonadales bacterium]|nr:hypothetical protein [Fimbriimonadales bacterium]
MGIKNDYFHYILLIILSAVIPSCVSNHISNSHREIEKVEIYYLPFQVETYLPVTVEGIQRQEYNVTRYLRKEIRTIMQIIEKATLTKQKFDELRVRFLIKFHSNGFIAMDKKGCIIKSDSSEKRKLPEKDFNLLKKLLDSRVPPLEVR